jgi:hypothetical protein
MPSLSRRSSAGVLDDGEHLRDAVVHITDERQRAPCAPKVNSHVGEDLGHLVLEARRENSIPRAEFEGFGVEEYCGT